MGLIGLALHALGLQGADETLHKRVIVAICFAAHAHDDATVIQQCSVVLSRILTATVRMRKSTQAASMATRERHECGLFHQCFIAVAIHGPADHHAGEDVKHHREIADIWR